MKKFLIILFTFCTIMGYRHMQNKNKIKLQNLEEMKKENILKPVKALIEAMQTENAEKIRAQFAPTATQAYGAEGIMKTAEETKKWIETDIVSRKGKVANPEYSVLNEREVVVTGQYSSIGYTNKANFLFTVENGLITSWRMRY